MINIDSVYDTIKSLLKKNQQGYIAPSEFNRYANIASKARFNELYGRPETYQQGISPRMAYSQTQLIDEKLSVFSILNSSLSVSGSGIATKPTDLVRMDAMNVMFNGKLKKVRRVSKDKESAWVGNSAMPVTLEYPIYVDYGTFYKLYPINIGQVIVSYLKQPTTVKWAYSVSGARQLYDPTNSVHFEWEANEEGNLIAKILTYAGISVSDSNAASFGAGEEIKGQ